MSRTDFATEQLLCERYESLARFYNADERRVRSRELDVGLWWREGLDGPLHRAAWVGDTGELYLVRLGPAEEGGGLVEVLARLEDRARLELVLAGWRERCGEPCSLEWLRERVALGERRGVECGEIGDRERGEIGERGGIDVISYHASVDGARARPRESAPRVLRSRRTAETAAGSPDRGPALQAVSRPADRRTAVR
jgi:hypothetical protein